MSAANERFAAALRSRGFSHDAAANWSLFNVRDLDEIEEPQPPPG